MGLYQHEEDLVMSKIDFETARKTMVDCQIRPSKVTNQSVLDAFLTVPREAFVGKSQQSMTPSLLKERVTHSCLIEVSESFIPDNYIRTSLGGND